MSNGRGTSDFQLSFTILNGVSSSRLRTERPKRGHLAVGANGLDAGETMTYCYNPVR